MSMIMGPSGTMIQSPAQGNMIGMSGGYPQRMMGDQPSWMPTRPNPMGGYQSPFSGGTPFMSLLPFMNTAAQGNRLDRFSGQKMAGLPPPGRSIDAGSGVNTANAMARNNAQVAAQQSQIPYQLHGAAAGEGLALGSLQNQLDAANIGFANNNIYGPLLGMLGANIPNLVNTAATAPMGVLGGLFG
jgi:hypothetical protein